jgi:hypothetical protein
MPLQKLILCLHGGSVLRKHVRYRLFRIREGKEEYDGGLKKFIENQFQPGMNWKNFTFEWDVSPNEPLKVITPFDWIKEGGRIVQLDSRNQICQPTAFTKQEM